MEHQKKKKWINQIGKGIGFSLLSLLLISSQWVWPEKVSAALLENGSKAQPLVEQGIANAKDAAAQRLNKQLGQTDWTIIRTTTSDLKTFAWYSKVPSSSTPNGNNTGLLQSAFYGNLTLKTFVAGQRSSVVAHQEFPVFSLDKNELPTSQEMSSMSTEEASSYSMNQLKLGTFTGFILDDTETAPIVQLSVVNDRSDNSMNGLLTVKNPNYQIDPNDELAVGSILQFQGGDAGDGSTPGLPIKNYMSRDVILPDGKSIRLNKPGLYDHFALSSSSYAKQEEVTLAYAAALKETELAYKQGESVETDPKSLVASITDDGGKNVPISDQSIAISWYMKPDSSTATDNGSAVIQIENPNGTTYLRVPYKVTAPVPGGDVTINYLDENQQPITGSETLTGNVDESYTSTPKDVTGWVLKGTPSNASGTFTDQPQTVNYIYEKAEGGDITVNYQDADGNELAPSETKSGKYGDDYATEAKEITGWTLTGTPTNASGTFTDQPQTVTYVYEKADAAPVTVKFVDEEGQPLAENKVLAGKYGNDFTALAKSFEGYTLVNSTLQTSPTAAPNEIDPTNNASVKGSFSDEAQTVTFVYHHEAGEEVAVHYVDENGQKLAEDDTLTGLYGEAYDTDPKSIEGYVVKEVPANAEGTFGGTEQEVTYVYEKAEGGNITVNYVDEDGNPLTNPVIVTGKYGDAYTTDAQTIDGWTLKETPENAAGTFTAEVQTVTYVYEKVAESQPVTPGKQDPPQPEPTQPSVTENGESAQVPSQTEMTTTEVAPLPKTGDQTAETSLLMGVGAAFLLLSGYVLRRTRNEKKKEA